MTEKQAEAQRQRRESEEWRKRAKELMALDRDQRREKVKRYQGYTAWPKLMEALGQIETEEE